MIPKLPRGAGTGAVRKAWTEHGVEQEWDKSNWAKARANGLKRRQLGDFERFKVMRLKKQVRFRGINRITSNHPGLFVLMVW